MLSIQLRKRLLREQVDAMRRELPHDVHAGRSAAVCRHLLAHPLLSEQRAGEAPIVFAFVPFRSEVNIMPILDSLWNRRHCVLLPRTGKEKGIMQLVETRSAADLAPGRWGMMEPSEGLPVLVEGSRIDLVLVPGLAFDRHGGRLGYGSGYYDRFFAELQRSCERFKRKLPQRVAPAFDFQVVDEVPAEPHDWRISSIVTESGWLACNA